MKCIWRRKSSLLLNCGFLYLVQDVPTLFMILMEIDILFVITKWKLNLVFGIVIKVEDVLPETKQSSNHHKFTDFSKDFIFADFEVGIPFIPTPIQTVIQDPEGYKYSFNYLRKESSVWYCCKRRSRKCSAGIRTLGTFIVEYIRIHTCTQECQ